MAEQKQRVFRPGKWAIGFFGGVKQVTKGDGTPVAGMFEIVIREPQYDEYVDPVEHRATFFGVQDGQPSRMQADIDKAQPSLGEYVGVMLQLRTSQSADGKRTFINWDARALLSLEALALTAKV